MRLKPTAASSVEFFHIVTFPERHVGLPGGARLWMDWLLWKASHIDHSGLIRPRSTNIAISVISVQRAKTPESKPPRLQYHKPPKCHHADGILTEMSRITKNSSLHSYVLRRRKTEYHLHFKCHCGGQNFQYFPQFCLGALGVLSILKQDLMYLFYLEND